MTPLGRVTEVWVSLEAPRNLFLALRNRGHDQLRIDPSTLWRIAKVERRTTVAWMKQETLGEASSVAVSSLVPSHASAPFPIMDPLCNTGVETLASDWQA